MRHATKTVATAVAAVALLSGVLPATTHARPKRKPKTFTAEGAFYGSGFVTHSTFISQCPELPATQGVDAYVVEVPVEFGIKPSEATIEATSVSTDGSLEMSFYSYGCEQGELYVEPPATVPLGTGFIVVQDIGGGAANFELTLTQK